MTGRGLRGWTAWLAALAIACNSFVLIVVNVAIYWARAAFIAAHPEESARKPPTISGAIEDPAIGAPFALAVTTSAFVLFVGVLALAALMLRALPREAVGLRALAWATVGFQLMTCTGMVVLSQYTFPHHTDMHMFGSYLAFSSEVIVVLLQMALSLGIARHAAAARALTAARLLHPGANRWRPRLVALCVACAVVFAFLFFAKDHTGGALRDWVFLVYVSAEPAFITLTLVILATYNMDLALTFRSAGRRRAAGLS